MISSDEEEQSEMLPWDDELPLAPPVLQDSISATQAENLAINAVFADSALLDLQSLTADLEPQTALELEQAEARVDVSLAQAPPPPPQTTLLFLGGSVLIVGGLTFLVSTIVPARRQRQRSDSTIEEGEWTITDDQLTPDSNRHVSSASDNRSQTHELTNE